MEEQTSHEVWQEIFDYIWDGTEGTPEDINRIMNLVDKYGELRIKDILTIVNND